MKNESRTYIEYCVIALDEKEELDEFCGLVYDYDVAVCIKETLERKNQKKYAIMEKKIKEFPSII